MMKLISIFLLFFVAFISGCASKNSAVNVYNTPPRVNVTRGAAIPHVAPTEENTAEADIKTEIDKSSFYFSYDEASSTASHDLSVFYIDNGLTPFSTWGRSYEYLNAEKFEHFGSEIIGPFDVSMGVYESEVGEFPLQSNTHEGNVYSLGVNISGPKLSKNDRPNIVVTLLLDISGSMSTNYAPEMRSDITSLLDVAKYGIKEMLDSLKSGDVVNLVTFDTNAQNELLNWEYNAKNKNQFVSILDAIVVQGSTNLDQGIAKAYAAAQASYDPKKSNRVIILTDAYANTGEVNSDVIAKNTVINGLEGIYFAGIGIGNSFNEAFLNELTDIGKGNYSAMITPEDGSRIFGENFTRFIDSAVKDVRFKLQYPNTLKHLIADSAAEQVSAIKDNVQTINFSFNSQQFFLENFRSSEVTTDDSITLEISFKNELGVDTVLSLEKPIVDLLGVGEDQIKAAAMAVALSSLVANQLTCSSVLNSLLFRESLSNQVFNKYHRLIEKYCD